MGDLGERSTTRTAFIVGPARSGTSLLYKTMCLHPDVAYISNWVARFGWSPLAALDRLPRVFPAHARRFWFGEDSNAYRYGRSRSLIERLFPTPVEGEPVYLRAGVARPGGPIPSRQNPVVSLPVAFDAIRKIAGGSCIVSKRIANNLRIPLLAEVFPDARFVVLVRDGRAVAASLSKVDWWEDSYVWWYGGTPRRWRAEGRDPWEICARNWVEELASISEGLRSVPTDQVLRLRYEDLVIDPVATLLRVADFLGIPRDRRWRDGLAELAFPDRSDRWRDGLDPSVVQLVTTIQETQLDELGYRP
jgi:Sulfotransferase family